MKSTILSLAGRQKCFYFIHDEIVKHIYIRRDQEALTVGTFAQDIRFFSEYLGRVMLLQIDKIFEEQFCDSFEA